MKLILLSDLHISNKNPVSRLDDLLITQYVKLGFVLNYANDCNGIILQAGDFFDSPRSYYTLYQVVSALEKLPNVDILTVSGQHDVYMYHYETFRATNLGILEQVGLVKLLKVDPYSLKGVDIYGCSWGQDIPKVTNKDKFNILVAHVSVGEEALFPGHEFTDAEIFLRKNKDYNLILVGDIHRQFEVKYKGRRLINTGPMLRREASLYNFGHSPKFVVFDTDTKVLEWVGIPHKPADEVLSRDHLEKNKENKLMLDEFIKSVDTEFEAGVSFKDNLMLFIKKNQVGSEVVELINQVMQE